MALAHVSFFSTVLKRGMSADILMPDAAFDQPPQVLYLLHSLSDDQTVWQRRTGIERYIAGRNLCVLMPNADRSFYTNMAHGPAYFTYIADEFPKIMARMLRFSARREDTFAAGFSMGGYGAYKLALMRPGEYGAVASISGALDMRTYFANGTSAMGVELEWIYGSPERMAGTDDDLMAVAERMSARKDELPPMYACCGTEDKVTRSMHLDFMARFQKDFSILVEEGPGVHNWEFVDPWLKRIIEWLPLRG